MATDKKRVNAYLDHALEAKAKKLAEDNQMSLSTLIAFLLNQAVETQKIQLTPSESAEAPAEPPAEAQPAIDDLNEFLYADAADEPSIDDEPDWAC